MILTIILIIIWLGILSTIETLNIIETDLTIKLLIDDRLEMRR